jgi:CDP-6-deoxy-D-xylo-4-hexulose-3-dehydrase
MNEKEMIEHLSKSIQPKYVKNYDNFKEGDFVQYSGQLWDDKELYAAMDTIMNGSWVVAGEKVARFQQMFSRRFNVKHSHMVNSGSSANLVLVTAAKKVFGWDEGDEIIVSPVGFPTTIAPIVQNGLKPTFVDIELDSLNFDVNLIENHINCKTKAIFVSPVLGNPPDMDKIVDICKKHDLVLLGDNCDSLGTLWKEKQITDLYYAWTTSFYPAHHISTGEGGMVCSNDDNFIKEARSISWWGRDCYCIGANNLLSCGTCGNRFDKWLDDYDGIIDHKYVFTNIGYNLKPLDLQGAIGLEQLKKFDLLESKRREYKNVIHSYIETNVPGARVIPSTEGADPSWFGVPVYCETQKLKERLVQYLEDNKIQTRSYFAGNILLHPGFKHLDNHENYPNSNLALSNVFFIGCSPLYNNNVIAYIEKVFKQWKE